MDDATYIKKELIGKCFFLIDQRIANAQQAINAAQESANTEGKSSAGDKYETGRAMAQIEREKAAHQLNEALILKNSMGRITIHTSGSHVAVGSLVKTDSQHFFIAVSMGKLIVEDVEYFVIAPATPIARILMGLKPGDQFSFNNQRLTIREIL